MRLMHYAAEESGAVTVDWVVLAAGIMLMTIPMTLVFGDYIGDIIDVIESKILDSTDVPELT